MENTDHTTPLPPSQLSLLPESGETAPLESQAPAKSAENSLEDTQSGGQHGTQGPTDGTLACPNCGDQMKPIPETKEFSCGLCWIYAMDGGVYQIKCEEPHQHTYSCMERIR